MPLPAAGQLQALNELTRIIKVSRGGLDMDGDSDLVERGAWLRVGLWLDGKGTFRGEAGGRDLGSREPLSLYIPAQFPFQYPRVHVRHERFAGLPHVEWGRWICLYASANEWNPGEGMWGFIDRLIAWYLLAARGQLTGLGQPWHPPVTYGAGAGGVLIVGADLPIGHERNDAVWTCCAVLASIGGDRFELRRWSPALGVGSGALDQMRRYMAEAKRDAGNLLFTAPLIALPESLGFIYPTTIGELTQALTGYGINAEDRAKLLRHVAVTNRDIGSLSTSGDDVPPPILLIGSPAADRVAVPGRIAHLAAWRIKAASPVSEITPLDWMKVYDQRPKSTIRRDVSRPVGWLRGRRVLVLGCGALGAPIAEHCIRGGVGSLVVIDNGVVNPGILVRQPYMYRDVGRSKAKALSERLNAISPQTAITGKSDNALAILADDASVWSADLVIDATASLSVAAKIERLRWTSGKSFPSILSVMVGHRSEHGLITVAMPGSTGAGTDVLRKFAVSASSDPDLADVFDDFYPDPPRGDLFQPEPGCSDPTFVGSSADLAILAAQLLNAALTVLSGVSARRAIQQPTRSAVVVRLPTGMLPQAGGARLQWGNDVVFHDEVHNYQVRIDPAALADIRREVLRAAAVDGRNETGGVLLGQVDSACRVAWVSTALGFPPGSQASPGGLQLHIGGLRGELAERRRRSRGMVSFIGAWHIHPDGRAAPSQEDLDTMNDLVNGEQETLPQALLAVLGGIEGRWQAWILGSHRPDIHVEMFFPSSG
jgi:molybdopterin/thiamine biosynthesis adenylyltransferase/proteasome lid subunit RPN8/RPN11